MTAASSKISPPQLKYAVLAPQPVPQELAHQKLVVRFRINENGEPDPGATVIYGPIRSPYLERLSDALRQWRFEPAVLDGCAVPGWVDLALTL